MIQDNELILFDRINVIKDVNKKFNLLEKSYLSFSGGKDSTVLHYLIDLALPNNNIPRVFINTGIEYNDIVFFVKNLAIQDNRFIIINPTKNIKDILEKVGYPFKSKEHSMRVYEFNKGSKSSYIKKYISGYDKNGKKTTFTCPNVLKYQFEEKGKFNYSNLCCHELKKKPAQNWAKKNNKTIIMTGMLNEEGGNRSRLGCLIKDQKGVVKKFHPLIKVNSIFEDWFIEKYKIEICKLYKSPFFFKRTGCKGCPYAVNLQEELDMLALYLPNEKRQCEYIWKPVYEEYRRLNYRLRNQMSLFD